MCNCLLCHSLHTDKLRLSNIYESMLSGSSVPIFYSSSVSLSDEIHTFLDDDTDTGNSCLLSISDDDLIMYIFVILGYYNTMSIPAFLLSTRRRTQRQVESIFNRTWILSQTLLSWMYDTTLESFKLSYIVLNLYEETVERSSFSHAQISVHSNEITSHSGVIYTE